MKPPLLLCYHAVSEEWPAPLAVRPNDLRGHLQALANRGLRATTISEALSAGPGSGLVGLSFDDAFDSVLRLGLPMFEAFGFRATMFVPTGFVGLPRLTWRGIENIRRPRDPDELRPLDWDGVRVLAESGWEIGSHTVTHPSLPDLDDVRAFEEIAEPKREIEDEVGRPCTVLAYPYGRLDGRICGIAAASGYTDAVATLPGRLLHPSSRFAWPRLVINRVDGSRRFSGKTSGAAMRLRASAAWGPIATSRRRLRRAGARR